VIKGSLEDTSHFGRRFIPSGFRCENSEYADIPALSRLDGQAPQRLKLRSYSLREPDASFYHTRIGFCKELTTWRTTKQAVFSKGRLAEITIRITNALQTPEFMPMRGGPTVRRKRTNCFHQYQSRGQRAVFAI
jgi:hypothetical protein